MSTWATRRSSTRRWVQPVSLDAGPAGRCLQQLLWMWAVRRFANTQVGTSSKKSPILPCCPCLAASAHMSVPLLPSLMRCHANVSGRWRLGVERWGAGACGPTSDRGKTAKVDKPVERAACLSESMATLAGAGNGGEWGQGEQPTRSCEVRGECPWAIHPL